MPAVDDGVLEALVLGQKRDDHLSNSLLNSSQNNNNIDYFWGAPTAAINWCEEDHHHSSWVAEFFNTFSNAVFVAVGCWGVLRWFSGRNWGQDMQPHALMAAVCVVLTGLASGAFHATLMLEWQRADEIFENGILIALLHRPRIYSASGRRTSTFWPVLGPAVVHFALAAVGIMTITAFLFCELHLITAVVLAFVKLRRDVAEDLDPITQIVAKGEMRRAFWWVVAGALCWLVDRTCCSLLRALPVNPQLHAWWHLCTAMSLHVAMGLIEMFPSGNWSRGRAKAS
jgi:dihydroceramidase